LLIVFQPRPNSKSKRSIEHEYERVVDVGMYREIDVHKEYQRHTESILGPLKRPLITTLPQNNVTNIQTKQNKTKNKNKTKTTQHKTKQKCKNAVNK
jgi:hypothetical protein